ncbi:MAG: hypothetical protein AAGF81_01285 [Pseudomonadota bacterium]
MGQKTVGLTRVMGGLKISTLTANTLASLHDPYCEETNEIDLSALATRMLLGLHDAYPSARDASGGAKTDIERTMIDQLWSNFRAQGIVGGTVHQGVLSESGHDAVQGMLASAMTNKGQHDLTGEAASLLLLGVMRRHFWQEAEAN